MRNKTEKRVRTGAEGGFSLVEVLIAMAVLAAVSIPLMKYFSDSLRHSSMMAMKQKATALCQQKVEELKAVDTLIELVTEPDTTEKYTVPYLVDQGFAPINYTAKDGSDTEEKFTKTGEGTVQLKYVHPTDPDAPGYMDPVYENYDVYVKLSTEVAANEVEHPIIYGIDDTEDLLAVEREQMKEAVMYFWALDNTYVMNQRADLIPAGSDPVEEGDPDDPADPYPWLRTYSQDEIKAKLVRTVYIDVSKVTPPEEGAEPYFLARVYFEYKCKGLYPTSEDPAANLDCDKVFVSDLANIKSKELSKLYLLYDIYVMTVEEKDADNNIVSVTKVMDDEVVLTLPDGFAPELILVCQNWEGLKGNAAYGAMTYKVRVRQVGKPTNLSPVDIRTNIFAAGDGSGLKSKFCTGETPEGAYDGSKIKTLTDTSTTVQVINLEVSVCPRGGDVAEAYTTVTTTKGE